VLRLLNAITQALTTPNSCPITPAVSLHPMTFRRVKEVQPDQTQM
jgi:hypothetical protein